MRALIAAHQEAKRAEKVAKDKVDAAERERLAKVAAEPFDRLVRILHTSDGAQSPGELPLEYLSACTSKWADENKIGEGVFGQVYIGVDGERKVQFVVKKMNLASLSLVAAAAEGGGGQRLGSKMFRNEVAALSSFRRNPFVVKLVGFTSHSELSMCLVYEYCVGGALDKALLGDESAAELTWKQRVRILSGVVKALHFLHKGGGGERCFHRDVKSANICLTATLSPKLIDCGLAKFISDDAKGAMQMSSLGGRPGTMGYMCPDYADGTVDEFNESTEVFALGVVLLELITGTITLCGGAKRNLFSHFVKRPKERLEDCFDARASGDGPCPAELVAALTELARNCLVENSEKRISLLSVLNQVNDLERQFCRPVFTDSLVTAFREERAAAALKSDIAASVASSQTRTCQVCFDDKIPLSGGIACSPDQDRLHFYCFSCFDKSFSSELDRIMSTDALLSHHRSRDGKVRCLAHNDGCESLYTDSQLSRALDDARFAHYRAAQNGVFEDKIQAKLQEEMQGRVAAIKRDADKLVESARGEIERLTIAMQKEGDAREARAAAARLEEARSALALRQAQADKDELARTLKKEFPNARQCGQCGFGPIDHAACWDLQTHQGERRQGSVIRNNCPRCQWTTRDINHWPRWNGQLP